MPAPRLSQRGLFTWAGCAAIAALVALAYCKTFSVPFVFDDLPAIVTNSSIQHWATAFDPPGDGATVMGRPLLNLSFAANYAAGALSVRGYHLINLAIHLLAALTLFGIARRTLRLWGAAAADPAALTIALIWALHPLDTESVTYVVQRAESLMGLFYLLTLYCFVRYADPTSSDGLSSGSLRSFRGPNAVGPRNARSVPLHGPSDEVGLASGGGSLPLSKPSSWWGWLSIACCLLGMATKEVMVSAPVIVLLYDRTFVSGSFREAWRRHRCPLLGLGSTWILLGLLVAGTHGRGGTSGFGLSVSWGKYALTQFPAVGRYLALSLWPRHLIFDYGAQWAENFSVLAAPLVVVSALAVAAVWAFFRGPGLASALGTTRSTTRAAGFLGLWFFAILAPTSLVPGMRQTAAEHRMYLALIPLVALSVTSAFQLGARQPKLCFAAGLFVAAVYGAVTLRRNYDYRSDLALWTTTAAELPANPFAHNNLGLALLQTERPAAAIAEFQEALRRKPDYSDADNNWGSVLLSAGDTEAALGHFRNAVQLDDQYAAARSNLGSALAKLGQTQEASIQLQEALRLAPNSSRIHANYGKLLAQTGQMPKAIAEYERAVELDSNNAEAYLGLGVVHERTGQQEQARGDYEAALREKPDFADAHNNLGKFFAQSGRLPDALPHFEAAVRLAPGNAGFHANLGMALAQSGRTAQAIEEMRAALRINPALGGVQSILTRLEQEGGQAR